MLFDVIFKNIFKNIFIKLSIKIFIKHLKIRMLTKNMTICIYQCRFVILHPTKTNKSPKI